VGSVATLPFGVLADRIVRTPTLAAAICLWGGAMIWSAAATGFGMLVVARLFLGIVTAAAGPLVASLVGDYFGAEERGRIYGFILTGELIGVGIGFAVTGDLALISWRLAFGMLAAPAFVLAWLVWRLPEPERGAQAVLPAVGATRERHGDGVESDAQRLARERGYAPASGIQPPEHLERMSLLHAARYVLRVRTNVLVITASALGYYFLGGVQTFGAEFTKRQYGTDQALANLLLVIVGVGALAGVLAGGAAGDALLRRGWLTARVAVAATAGAAAAALFIPAILASGVLAGVPWLVAAAFVLGAQNPPLDAARLDIMPPRLWGRAEGIRTLLRSLAQALAPLLFGAVSDYVFGGGRSGLQWTFAVMLVPLLASSWLLWRARRTYPGDVAAAAAAH
jgi:MFS family permease